MTEETAWPEHQVLEQSWWGDCANTYGEETKQLVYASRVGFAFADRGGPGPIYDLGGRSIVDLGGGPVSLLLKCVNFGQALVVDPCPFPDWVALRYAAHGVAVLSIPAEDFGGDELPYDEAWIYNVLQHTKDPEGVVMAARRSSRLIRLFEWIDIPAYRGHPNELTVDVLRRWLDTDFGVVEEINQGGAVGRAFYGLFPSFDYEEAS